MSVDQIIKKTSAILSDETRWTQGSYAKNEIGGTMAVESDKASCFCLAGAVYRAGYELEQDYNVIWEAFNRIAKHVPGAKPGSAHASILNWNDDYERKFSEVRAVLDKTLVEAA